MREDQGFVAMILVFAQVSKKVWSKLTQYVIKITDVIGEQTKYAIIQNNIFLWSKHRVVSPKRGDHATTN